jgi:mannose-1-phosphate guanylyltransferase / mannose-6-phosphate isomerase
MIVPVILSGGTGSRLWPLSRPACPKQFLPLVTGRTLLQDTVLRCQALEGVMAPVVVCNAAHRFQVAEQLREVGFGAARVVLEPVGRNTAPAVAVAALLAQQQHGPETLLLVMPADHAIRNGDAFAAAARRAIAAAEAGALVTFGIVPTRPETGFGYIERGAEQAHGFAVSRFVEKPDAATAESFLASGRYLWNSGMFVFSAANYLTELERHASDIVRGCERAMASAESDRDFTRLGKEFAECRSDSVDYAVMEKTDRAIVVPLDAGWSDVGSFGALHEFGERDRDGNLLRGDVLVEDSRDSYVVSSGRLVVALGLEGHLVVETADAVLVSPLGRAQDVRRVVDRLAAAKRPEVGEAEASDADHPRERR